MDKTEQLKKWLAESRNTVFFGGAGVSTESGIPDFRSTDGLYNEQWKYPPETIISRGFFLSRPEAFYDFYRQKILICLDAQPNPAHRALAKWEQEGRLAAVVTQNIDGLHQAAGSKTVWELHGSVMRNNCMDCGRAFDAHYVRDAVGVPRCDRCGGIIKPDVVLYQESLDDGVLRSAVDAISQAELLIVGGTSLVVYPAAGLLSYFRGSHLVIVNKSPTPQDRAADLVIAEPIGEVFAGC